MTCITQTAGQILAGGYILEPVLGASKSEPLQLALWDGAKATFAQRIEFGGVTYEPAPLDSTVLRVLKMPAQVAPAESVRQLVGDLSRVMVKFTNLPERCVVLSTRFVLASWHVMNFSTAPWLSIVGSDDFAASQLLRLLSCFCRRALPLFSPSVARVCGLPRDWHFTLLVREAQLSRSTQRLLQATSMKDQFIPIRGQLLDFYGPIATFTSEPCSSMFIGAPPAIEIPALPSAVSRQLITPEVEHQLARDFQPRFLGYFFRNNSDVRPSPTDGANLSFSMRELARNLAAVTPRDKLRQTEVINALMVQDQATQVSRGTDEKIVILEAILAFIHEGRLEPYVGQITERTNTILRERGGVPDLAPRAVGAQLRLMQFSAEPRDRIGYRLLLTEPVRRRVHELAFAYGALSVLSEKSRCLLCQREGQISPERGNGAKKQG
jgi:hypothetical protein